MYFRLCIRIICLIVMKFHSICSLLSIIASGCHRRHSVSLNNLFGLRRPATSCFCHSAHVLRMRLSTETRWKTVRSGTARYRNSFGKLNVFLLVFLLLNSMQYIYMIAPDQNIFMFCRLQIKPLPVLIYFEEPHI